ncbi:hypothetical protein L8S13_21485 [Vibrio lentus]|uniref:hypothetical protein n=1 Tax=Vibrio lentus TaxID=136468 RepID=UPI002469675E|nr:hypothetical protein [Vibrio lentus]MDH5928875.1 hypothetical protein [Vibrio lentus]
MYKLFLKVLGNQESGVSSGREGERGRYVFIPKKARGIFPSFPKAELNEKYEVNLKLPNGKRASVTLVHHNSKILNKQKNGRDEVRMYYDCELAQQLKLEPGSIFILIQSPDGEHFVSSITENESDFSAVSELAEDCAESALGHIDLLDGINITSLSCLIRIQDVILSSKISTYEHLCHLTRIIYDNKCALRGCSLVDKPTNDDGLEVMLVDSRGPLVLNNAILISRDLADCYRAGDFSITNSNLVAISTELGEKASLKKYEGKSILPSSLYRIFSVA